MDYRKYTAPCGIDCFNCEIFKDNITNEMRKRIALLLKKDPDTFACEGCKVSGCTFISNECETKKCVEEKGHEFCFECESFPCSKLQPCYDKSEKTPHNFKVFNLCRIKAIGVDEWVKESRMIRDTYFKGKLTIGSGPALEE